MIYFAMVSRLSDGLILTANSDSSSLKQIHGLEDAFRTLQLLAKMSGKLMEQMFNVKCTMTVNPFCIHFVKTSIDLCLYVLCDKTYPAVLAFSLLQELQKEYIDFYGWKKTQSVQRPYALMDFDIPLQKMKHRYNNPRTMLTKLDLHHLSLELKQTPPHEVYPSEVHQSNGYSKTDTSNYKSTAAVVYKRYLPIPFYGVLSLVLNCFCAFLNLTRGIAVINDAHIETIYDSDHYQYGATFIVCCLLSLYQAYLMCYPTTGRKPLAFATLASICLCQLYLWEYRNNIGIMFHVTVACYATFVIMTRKVQEKLPQYTL